MKKILFGLSISLLFIQCKKQNEIVNLAEDNDYQAFNLNGRVCKINQSIAILTNNNFNIEDKNAIYIFSTSGYLINDSIFDNQNRLIEVNNYEKLKLPLTKKQFLNSNDFVLSETIYDSLKNISNFRKTTSKNQIIEEQRNTFSDDLIIREDYYIAGKNSPKKTIKYFRDGSLLKSKVIYSETKTVLDSIVYDYFDHKINKESHYNHFGDLINSINYAYNGDNYSEITYFNSLGEIENIEKFEYNKKNQLTYKNTFSNFDKSVNEEINTYNENSKIEKIETKLNYQIITNTNFIYNDKTDLEKVIFENYSNKENFEKKVTYTYDDKGNWLTKEVSINKVPTYKVTREITYCTK